jgi:hypothetical protein
MFAGTPAAAELAGAAAAEVAGAAAAEVVGAAAALVVAAAAGADEAAGVDDFFELHAVATKARAVRASTAEVLRLRAVTRIILFPSNGGYCAGTNGTVRCNFELVWRGDSLPSPRPSSYPSQCLRTVGDDDTDEEQASGDDVLHLRGNVHEGECLLNATDDDDRDYDTEDRAATAENGDAAK